MYHIEKCFRRKCHAHMINLTTMYLHPFCLPQGWSASFVPYYAWNGTIDLWQFENKIAQHRLHSRYTDAFKNKQTNEQKRGSKKKKKIAIYCCWLFASIVNEASHVWRCVLFALNFRRSALVEPFKQTIPLFSVFVWCSQFTCAIWIACFCVKAQRLPNMRTRMYDTISVCKQSTMLQNEKPIRYVLSTRIGSTESRGSVQAAGCP